MTYLILRLQSMGNVAMTVPVIDSVRRHHLQDTFVVVAKKRLSALFYGMPNVMFHEADFKYGKWKGLIRLYHELKTYHIDTVIDLQDNIRTRLIRWMFRWHGAKVVVVDYGRTEKHRMTLVGAQRMAPLLTEFERYERTFHFAGLQTDNEFEAIPEREDAKKQILARYGSKEDKWIGVAPFAKFKSNTLPYREMKALIGRLSRAPHTRVYLFGAGSVECEWLRQWASVMPNVVSVAGELPLEQELELMRQLDGMICMDSANQHLAAVVGKRALSIWMGTHPNIGFGAWKQGEADRIEIPLACRPCTIHGTNHCRFGNFVCQQINIESIIKQFI